MSNTDDRLYDLSLLEEMAQGDEDFMKEMAETFISSVPTILNRMVYFCKAQEWVKMGDEAHTLKSNIDTLQINSIRSEIRIIEINGKTGVDLDICSDLVAKVEQVLKKAMEQIKQQYNL